MDLRMFWHALLLGDSLAAVSKHAKRFLTQPYLIPKIDWVNGQEAELQDGIVALQLNLAVTGIGIVSNERITEIVL
jgi:hypothetical protein